MEPQHNTAVNIHEAHTNEGFLGIHMGRIQQRWLLNPQDFVGIGRRKVTLV
jgi:hypothetical protein